MKDDSELPPPVTRHSSKADLWEELECVRREVNSQQTEVIAAREAIKRYKNEVELLRYQLRIVRAAIDMEIR